MRHQPLSQIAVSELRVSGLHVRTIDAAQPRASSARVCILGHSQTGCGSSFRTSTATSLRSGRNKTGNPMGTGRFIVLLVAIIGLSLLNRGDAASPQNACSILGTGGADKLTGTSGKDRICGLGGSDRIRSLGGNDRVIGGRGNDQLNSGAGDDSVAGGPGEDQLLLGPGDDRGNGGAGSDDATGARGDDGLWGGRGDDSLYDPAGKTVEVGRRGSDDLTAFGGRALLKGGRGSDGCLDAHDSAPHDAVVGGPGRDTYDADPGDVIRSAELRRLCTFG
jgi:hypothetical protein